MIPTKQEERRETKEKIEGESENEEEEEEEEEEEGGEDAVIEKVDGVFHMELSPTAHQLSNPEAKPSDKSSVESKARPIKSIDNVNSLESKKVLLSHFVSLCLSPLFHVRLLGSQLRNFLLFSSY